MTMDREEPTLTSVNADAVLPLSAAGGTTLLQAEFELLGAAKSDGLQQVVARLPVGTFIPAVVDANNIFWLRSVGSATLAHYADASGAMKFLQALASSRYQTEQCPELSLAAERQDLLANDSAKLLKGITRGLSRAASNTKPAAGDRFDEALRGFGDLLDGRFRRAPEDRNLSPLAETARVLAESQGVKPVAAVPQHDGEAVQAYLERFAAANRLRVRKLDRNADFSGENGVIGFLADATPVAIMSRIGSGLVRCDDKTSVARESLQNANVYAFYPTMADTQLSYKDILLLGTPSLRPEMLQLALCGILGSLAALLTPALAAEISRTGVHSGDIDFLRSILIVLVVALLAEASFRLIGGLTELRLQGRASQILHSAMLDRLLRFPSAMLRASTYSILTTQLETVDKLRGAALKLASVATFAIANVLAAGCLIAFHNPTLGLFAILAATVLVAAAILFGWLQFQAIYEGERMDIVVLAFGYDLIRLAPVIRGNRAERRAFAQWALNFLAFQSRVQKSARISNRFKVLEIGWEATALAVAFGTLALSGSRGGIDAGAAVLFVLTLKRLFEASKQLSHCVLDAAKQLPSAKLARSFVETRIEPHKPPIGARLQSGKIDFENLSFAYGAQNVLNGIELSIASGDCVGIVGPSGAGKSTILRLLLGLETPTSGRILIDGMDAAKIDRRQLARQIGFVPQNGQLFPGSIFDNIRGITDITLEQAWRYAEMADVGNELHGMPMGMSTIIGENGSGLSRGQIQRLFLARALALDPTILVLDEATSALDAAMQVKISATVERLSITRIIVAHRPEALIQCNRIATFENGKLIACEPASEYLFKRFSSAA